MVLPIQVVQVLQALLVVLVECIVLHMRSSLQIAEVSRVQDDLTDHLQVLYAEFEQTVDEMEAQNATSAAAAYYHAQLICERFLATPGCFD